tara:strand:+ start:3220 stop:5079 length:1860 start_codon:yes stop_codon:yes gene_type:complete
MKNLCTAILIVISSGIVNAQDIIYFGMKEGKINTSNKSQLKKTIEKHDLNNINEIIVRGYSDTTGESSYNEKLSRIRAANTKTELVKQGVPGDKIKVKWFGETDKFDKLNTYKNRCVEITVVPDNLAAYKPIPVFYEKSQVEIQTFKINTDRDTVIQGEQGTIIKIPSGAFSQNNLTLKKSTIDFQLKEVFLKSDMILENLTTVSGNRILETQGMIYTNAMLNETPVELQKKISILTPTDTIMDDAQIFDGNRDLHSDEMNWSLNNNTALRNFTVKDVTQCPVYFPGCGSEYENSSFFTRCDQMYRMDYDARLECRRRAIYRNWLSGHSIRCPFFFCRIRSFFNNFKPFNGVKKTNGKVISRLKKLARNVKKKGGLPDNKDLAKITKLLSEKQAGGKQLTEEEKNILELTRSIQREDSLIKNGLVKKEQFATCSKLEDLMKEYGVNNIEELMVAINRPLLDEFGVSTMKDLMDTLPKVNLKNIEVAYKNKKISYEDYKFYVFNSSNLGWKNVDVFKDVPRRDMISLKVSEMPTKEIDIKLVFVDREFVLPGKILDKENFYFTDIPKNEKAWIVGVKYIDGKPLLALRNITTKEKDFDLDFKLMSLQELKEALKVIDFKS